MAAVDDGDDAIWADAEGAPADQEKWGDLDAKVLSRSSP
jgi:hypothetical protein